MTQIDGQLLRRHDIELPTRPRRGSSPATVSRIVRPGFEVRVETLLDGHQTWAQLTRGAAARLNLKTGDTLA